jgi:hypothetical protein
MLQAFLDSLTKPSELAALYKYKFAAKSASAKRLQQTLAKDASKKRCYDFLNMVKEISAWFFSLRGKGVINPTFFFFFFFYIRHQEVLLLLFKN